MPFRLVSMRPFALLLALFFHAQAALADASIFLYHRFGEDRYPSTSIRIEQFESHLAFLAENHYEVWPLERIVDYLDQGKALPARTVAITVDDAYLSVYEQAYPRLKALGWPFTVFVSTEPVDRNLKDYMSWEQMRKMARHGARYGNHSASHAHLVRRAPDEDDAQWRRRIRREVETAQQRLRAELGVTEKLFAYPYGEFDQALADLIAEAGYVGFGQQSGPVGRHTDRRAIPRFPMSEPYAELADFRLKARTLAMPLSEVTPWDPLRGTPDRPRLELTFSAPLKRASEVRCYVTGQGLAAVEWLDAGFTRLAVRAERPLPAGRSRYNCTVPASDGQFYWYSHPWITFTE